MLGGLVSEEDLNHSLSYILKRLELGFATDIATQSQALKLFFQCDLIPQASYEVSDNRLENEGSLFLSHTHKDKSFVRRLAKDLQSMGNTCLLDEAELLPGDSIMDSIEGAIIEMQYLGIVLTPEASISWVKKELRMAQIEELLAEKFASCPSC